MYRSARLSLPVFVAVVGACTDAPGEFLDPASVTANPVFGQMAFEQSCAGCHASRDGFDLRAFGFGDSTIIRRAVKHVDSSAARNIAAHVRTLSAPPIPRDVRLFQPGGKPLGGDTEFALGLFGRDAWPEDMTTARLAAIDPRGVRVAIRLPVWSIEGSNLDWMPDFVLPSAILDYSGGMVRAAVAGYHAAPTAENLIRAVNALRVADRASANPHAPCVLEDSLRVRYRECFETRRWTSTLVALHVLRNGVNAPLGGRVHDIWWDVGNAARKSRADRSVPIANVNENWATWMFLGWSFDPSLHSSSYTGGGFRQLGLMRHATFVALRSQVARARNSVNVYEDLANAARFAPASWTASATSFGLRHAGERLAAGDVPASPELRATAIASVNTALTEAGRKLPAAERERLEMLAQPVIASLLR